MPARRAPARGVGVVARLGCDHGDEDLLDQHPDRQLGVHLLDELGIERALRLAEVELGQGIVDGAVDGLVLPAPLVGPRRALGLAGAVPPRGRDRGVVATLMPAGGEVEGVVVIRPA